jgi:glyoxylase-like metal-dependent hydrolase (beta-lactamase superfamily II)
MYNGRVTVAGPADVRELPGLVISKLAVGPYNNNAYLLRCTATGASLLIDAAAEPERLLDLVGDGSLDYVLTTHRHADHWQALAEVVTTTGARTIAGALDSSEIPVATSLTVSGGTTITFGEITLRVFELAGHTEGSISVLYDDPTGHGHLFTGDCLFPGGIGRTLSEPEFDSLYEGVVDAFFALPDETWVYPGHGQDTTIGQERPHLEEWRLRRW